MITIELTKGYKTTFDRKRHLADLKWYARLDCDGRPYAVRAGTRIQGTRKVRYLHREIIDAKSEELVDHINGNTLDNRIENLRICTRAENQRNRGKQKNNTSGYKGVFWDKQRQRWLVQIRYLGKSINLGRTDDLVEGAHIYDRKALELHGDFARLNFPLEVLNVPV